MLALVFLALLISLVARDSAEDVAADVLEGFNEGDFERVCERFSEDLRDEEFDDKDVDDCEGWGEEAALDAEGFHFEAKLGRVDEEGDTATARYSIVVGMFSDTAEMQLVKEDGSWRVDDLD